MLYPADYPSTNIPFREIRDEATQSSLRTLLSVLEQLRNRVAAVLNRNATFRGARVVRNAVQGINNNSFTAIAWTSESYDTDDIHDTAVNNNRLTVPANVSRVQLTFNGAWATGGAGTRRFADIRKNSIDEWAVDERDSDAVSGRSFFSISTGPVDVIPGDYFEARVFQLSGGVLNFGRYDGIGDPASSFSMQILEAAT